MLDQLPAGLHKAIQSGLLRGIHTIDSPEGRKLAADFGHREVHLDPAASGTVLWGSQHAAILLRPDQQHQGATLELAAGIVRFLTARPEIIQEIKRKLPWMADHFHFDPDDDPEAGQSGGSVQVPSSDPTYGRVRVLDNAEKEVLAPVYGSSLDLDRIVLSPLLGIHQLEYTLTVPSARLANAPRPFGDGVWVNIINVGETAFLQSTDPAVLVHEAAHCWQSQHHYNPVAYIWNSLASQAAAAASGRDAYSYKRGKKFRKYGAEQLAEQVENNFVGLGSADEQSIADHMKNTEVNKVDGQNVLAMLIPRCEKPGDPGVFS